MIRRVLAMQQVWRYEFVAVKRLSVKFGR